MKILDRFEEWVMSLKLLTMTSLAFMQVVRRYVFNTGCSWTLELASVCFAIMIFAGLFEEAGWKPAGAVTAIGYVLWSIWLIVFGVVLLV